MKLFHIGLILVCVIGISAGQVLFKLAAPFFPLKITMASLIGFLFNKYLISALFLYGISTFLWVYVLKLIPLSMAYPFMALAFIIVPVMGAVFLNEPLNAKTLIGIVFIISGLIVISK